MANTYHNAIEQLYVAYFNRPADTAGLAYWENVVEAAKGDTTAVSAAFAASAEYRSAFAGKDASAIVATVYHNLFGRAPEPAGVAFWADLLKAGRITIDSVVKNIADGAQSTDKTAFANKVAAATAFTAALDTPQEVAAYAGPQSALAGKAFLAAIRSDASLANILVKAKLDAALVDATHTTNVLLTGAREVSDSHTGRVVYSAPLEKGFPTFQSDDTLYGGNSTLDTVKVDVANRVGIADAPKLYSVERVEAHAVAVGADAAAGSLQATSALLDAEFFNDLSYLGSIGSSADLRITNVGLNAKNTADVTIEMRGTQGADVDLGVYFNQFALVDRGLPDNVLRLALIDATSAAKGGAPLLNNEFDEIYFTFNDNRVKLASKAIGDALTYDQLLVAIKDALAATPGMQHITATLGREFTGVDATGANPKGREIVLTSSVYDTFSTKDSGVGNSTSPALNQVNRAITTTQDPQPPHVASTIILDDVGRGGAGSDLVVGSMILGGFGEGVERFAIEVRNTSSLQTIASTNNALRDVVITNGYASLGGDIERGKLAVLGSSADTPASATELMPRGTVHASGMGFTDIRTLDASAMKGDFQFTADITSTAIGKYINEPGSRLTTDGTTALAYSGGAGNDSMKVTISGDVLAAVATKASLPGFAFSANGGAGNDLIVLTTRAGEAGWYAKHAGHANLAINAGEGDDEVQVNGAGNVKIDLGAGNDSYTSTGVGPGDNILIGGIGNDRITLGTTLGADAAASSNDKVTYQAGLFGNDTVLNFRAGSDAGADQLDFTALGGRGSAFAGAAISSSDLSITVQQQNAGNDSAAEVAALYGDGGAATHIFVAVDGANVGQVYVVVDTAAGPVHATLVGSIDLGATGWNTLGAANFA